jgi:NAD(P)-dependent dehydrogenase (short-subunit alcohol dehydrogenase family)
MSAEISPDPEGSVSWFIDQGDVAKLADLDRLYETVKAVGRIDIVFANAGIAEFTPLGSITEEHFDKLFNYQCKRNIIHGAKSLTATK